MSRLRIYALFGDAQRYAGRVSYAESHEMHFSSFSFDNLVERTGKNSIQARREQIDRVLDEMDDFDAVFSDSPDLMLLHFVRRKRKMRPMPWLVNEVDRFKTAGLVRGFIQQHYREDPFPGALGAGEILWFTIMPGLAGYYHDMGIPAGNVFYLPMARASIGFFLPELIDAQDRVLSEPAAGRPACPIAPGAILAIGSHERDYSCLARALDGTGLEAEVICNLALYPDRPAGSLVWHDSMPAGEYLEAIRNASMVVLPLLRVDRALGQMSCALPMRLGKAIVATRMPSLSAHIEDGQSGLCYPAGDAQALRGCLQKLWGDAQQRSRLGAAAAAREKELSLQAQAAIEQILERLVQLRN